MPDGRPGSTRLKEDEKESWLDFIMFDDDNPPSGFLNTHWNKIEIRSIEVDHPFVDVIGGFAIAAFNKVSKKHGKRGVPDLLHDFEVMECNYLIYDTAYYFSMTIEAIEEGSLGVYKANVVCRKVDGSLTLHRCFLAVGLTPVGKKAMAIAQLSNLRSIYEETKDLKKKIKVHLKATCKGKTKHMKGKKNFLMTMKWTRVSHVYGNKKLKAAATLVSLKQHHTKAMKGLRKVMAQAPVSLVSQDCNQTAKAYLRGRDMLRGMKARWYGNMCVGYDYFNPVYNYGMAL